jgi:hypothetical protein
VFLYIHAVVRLQPPAHAGSSLADFCTLKMEAIRSSETSVDTRSTRRHIPENGILHSHRRENLKSYIKWNWARFFSSTSVSRAPHSLTVLLSDAIYIYIYIYIYI